MFFVEMYKYNVMHIEGSLNDNASLEELSKKLNARGQKGYKLHSALPQVKEGSIVSTVLIFEKEDTTEDCALG